MNEEELKKKNYSTKYYEILSDIDLNIEARLGKLKKLKVLKNNNPKHTLFK